MRQWRAAVLLLRLPPSGRWDLLWRRLRTGAAVSHHRRIPACRQSRGVEKRLAPAARHQVGAARQPLRVRIVLTSCASLIISLVHGRLGRQLRRYRRRRCRLLLPQPSARPFIQQRQLAAHRRMSSARAASHPQPATHRQQPPVAQHPATGEAAVQATQRAELVGELDLPVLDAVAGKSQLPPREISCSFSSCSAARFAPHRSCHCHACGRLVDAPNAAESGQCIALPW